MNSEELLKELKAVLTGFWLTDLSNFTALFFERLPDLNWIGFYLSDGEQLKLGPFQGKVACTEIDFHRGVCGAAFTSNKILNVSDVHKFPGHIACDSASQSELVLPLQIGGKLVGVLDIDSPIKSRFTQFEEDLFQIALVILANKIKNIPRI